jgi:hypothetical protein
MSLTHTRLHSPGAKSRFRRYSLYLPDKTLLQQKLAEWTQEFEEVRGAIEAREDAPESDEM